MYFSTNELQGLGKFRLPSPKQVFQTVTQVITHPQDVAKIIAENRPKNLKEALSFKPIRNVIKETEKKFLPPELVAEINKARDKGKKVVKVVLPILAIVAVFIPVLAPFAVYFRLASVALAAKEKREQLQAQKKAAREIKQEEEKTIATLVEGGLTRAEAEQVLKMIESGMDSTQAIQAVLGSAPRAVNVTATDALRLEPEQAQVAFMTWLRGWRPEFYKKLLEENPAAVVAPGGDGVPGQRRPEWGVSQNTGEWLHAESGIAGLGQTEVGASIADWISGIANVATSVMKYQLDRDTLKVQLERARAGMAPAPTAQAQDYARRQDMANRGQPPSGGMFAGMMVPLAVAGGLGIGAWFLFARRRRR